MWFNNHLIQSQFISSAWWPIALDENNISSSHFELFAAQMHYSEQPSFALLGDLLVHIVKNILTHLDQTVCRHRLDLCRVRNMAVERPTDGRRTKGVWMCITQNNAKIIGVRSSPISIYGQ